MILFCLRAMIIICTLVVVAGLGYVYRDLDRGIDRNYAAITQTLRECKP